MRRTLKIQSSAFIHQEVAMNRKHLVANAILWASAIVASAIVGAPAILSVVLLPTLAACALILDRDQAPSGECSM
jgi:hypothetical protein